MYMECQKGSSFLRALDYKAPSMHGDFLFRAWVFIPYQKGHTSFFIIPLNSENISVTQGRLHSQVGRIKFRLLYLVAISLTLGEQQNVVLDHPWRPLVKS